MNSADIALKSGVLCPERAMGKGENNVLPLWSPEGKLSLPLSCRLRENCLVSGCLEDKRRTEEAGSSRNEEEQ